MTQAFPLLWPTTRPRKPSGNRTRAAFSKKVRRSGKSHDETVSLSIADALDRLQGEVNRLGADDAILSTNVPLNLNGSPKSSSGEPADPAAALYFTLNDAPHCLPCDTYDRVADNIAAIAKHIEATRAIERYGVASIAEMFTGFTALPAPGGKRPWREIFGIDADFKPDPAVVGRSYRELAKMWTSFGRDLTELNVARDDAIAEIGGGS